MWKVGCIFTVGKENSNMAERNKTTKTNRVVKSGKSTNTKKTLSKKQQQQRKMMIVGIEIVCLLVLLVVVFVWSFVGKINFNSFSEKDAGINEDLSDESRKILEGYTNVALFGLDNRSEGNYKGGQSDVIMIASINNETKEVKLLSVYRDTYLHVGNDVYSKANSAYAKGGAVQAVQMLNSNLDLNITEYVCVDFMAMVEVIDALGGIEVEITEQEMQIINDTLWEYEEISGETLDMYDYLWGSGVQNLTGPQATSYARIRSTAGDDFKRTSRQRIVLEAMLNKAKEADVSTLLDICEVAFDDISTSLSLTEIMNLAKDVKSYTIVSTSGFPFDMTTATISGKGSCVVPISLENNVSQLYAYLFGAEGYVTSETVQFTSDYIEETTGVTENAQSINVSGYNDTAGQDGTVFD